jgi:hypothetical protein
MVGPPHRIDPGVGRAGLLHSAAADNTGVDFAAKTKWITIAHFGGTSGLTLSDPPSE